MKKTLIIILIILLCYLAFIGIFTNRKTICEPMININEKTNQYISWINENKEEFVPIRYSHIVNSNGELDWVLIQRLFEELITAPYKDFVDQDAITRVVNSASNSKNYIFEKEPIFLIKAPQTILLTHNKTITAVPIKTNTENTILLPRESVFNPTERKLENDVAIKDKIINLNKILLLDSDRLTNDNSLEKPAIYTSFTNCSLKQIYEHQIGNEKIPIYILVEGKIGDKDLQVSIY